MRLLSGAGRVVTAAPPFFTECEMKYLFCFFGRGYFMRRLKSLALLLLCFPVTPDLCCVPVYASDETAAAVEPVGHYLCAILFFLCFLAGNRLWSAFINSFEKGSV